MPPYTLLAKRTPTVKARATGGTCFVSGDASTIRSSPLIIWYRVLEETARKTPTWMEDRKQISGGDKMQHVKL